MNSDGKKLERSAVRNRSGLPAAPQTRSTVVQPKASAASPVRRPPVAPPAYRPQTLPRVLQAKPLPGVQPADPATRAGVAPAVYRPQPAPRVLQTKIALGQKAPAQQSSRQHVAQPVYRPEQGKIAQAKPVAAIQAERSDRQTSMRQISMPGKTRSTTVQRSIGLAELFGHDEWEAGGGRAPTGAIQNTVATTAAFAGLRAGGSIDAALLVAQVPAGCQNDFEIESRTQRGFKYSWNDTNGVAWLVWGHEPDAGAALGHVGGNQWSVRIRRGNQFLMSATINPPVGVAYDWAQANTPPRVQASHIRLTNI
jgi:hypothetical protein